MGRERSQVFGIYLFTYNIRQRRNVIFLYKVLISVHRLGAVAYQLENTSSRTITEVKQRIKCCLSAAANL